MDYIGKIAKHKGIGENKSIAEVILYRNSGFRTRNRRAQTQVHEDRRADGERGEEEEESWRERIREGELERSRRAQTQVHRDSHADGERGEEGRENQRMSKRNLCLEFL